MPRRARGRRTAAQGASARPESGRRALGTARAPVPLAPIARFGYAPPGRRSEGGGRVAGEGTEDRIDLSGLGVDFEWLMANASEQDGNTVLHLGDHDITLRGVGLSQLHRDDFLGVM